MKSIEIEITQEEKQMVTRLSKGETAKKMSKDLGINKSTLATKLKEIRTKYGVSNSVELVAYFLREGIIS